MFHCMTSYQLFLSSKKRSLLTICFQFKIFPSSYLHVWQCGIESERFTFTHLICYNTTTNWLSITKPNIVSFLYENNTLKSGSMIFYYIHLFFFLKIWLFHDSKYNQYYYCMSSEIYTYWKSIHHKLELFFEMLFNLK